MSKALIIGGGIAGTVTAMALQKAGHEAEVFEAYERGADGVGAFLTLAVNGIDALASLDLKDQVKGLGFSTPRMTLALSDGKPLADFPLSGSPAGGTQAQTVSRSDLYATLRDEAVRRGIRINYGKRLTTSTGTRATFADGTTADGDLLIGADGLRSRVRQIIDPPAPAPRYVTVLNTGGFAEGLRLDGEPGVMRMVFGKRAFFSWVIHPNGQVWWFANPPRRSEPTAAQLGVFSGDRLRAELIRLLNVDNTPAVEIINATREIPTPWPTYDFPTVPTWHRDNMIIIGDAAHATSPAAGQGASMAIEDGVTLARCLRDLPDIPAALRAYEQLRRERVEAVVAQGKRNGDAKATGPFTRILRDFFMKRILTKPVSQEEEQSWMWDHHIEWDERIAA